MAILHGITATNLILSRVIFNSHKDPNFLNGCVYTVYHQLELESNYSVLRDETKLV